MTDNIEPDNVLVNITISDAGSPHDSFGLLAMLSHNASFAERSRVYGSYDEVITDLATWSPARDSTSPEARFALAAFSQNPRPQSLLILRSTVSVTQVYNVGANVAKVGAVYAINVKGEGFDDATLSYTMTTPASLAKANDALKTALNAVTDKNYLAAFAPKTFVSAVYTANATTNELFNAANGLKTGDGPLQVTTSSAAPGGLAVVTDYYAVEGADVDHFKLATSFANAIAGTTIDITDAGTGVQHIAATGGAVSPATELVVTAVAAGDWFSIAPTKTSRARVNVWTSHAVSGMADDLTEIYDEDDSWYVLGVLYPSRDYVDDCADWIEAHRLMFHWDVNDSRVLSTYVVDTSDDIGSDGIDAAYARSKGDYHLEPDEFHSARLMGKFLPKDPGKVNLKFLAAAGSTPGKLKTSEKTALKARRMGWFEKIGGTAREARSTVFSTVNRFFDVTRNCDWLHDELLVDILDAETGSQEDGTDGNPFTPAGMQKIEAAIHKAFSKAVSQGVSADGLDQSVTMPSFADVDESDHANRELNGITANLQLAGFIDRVVASVNIVL